MNKEEIKLNESITNDRMKIYLDGESRLPTATDVKFLNENLLVAAHRIAGKMYIFKKEEDKYKKIEEIKIKINNKEYLTEAFVIIENRIYLAGYSENLIILEIEENTKLKIKELIKINNKGILYHGIKDYNGKIYLTPSNNSTRLEDNIIEYNPETKEIIKLPIGDISNKSRIKDILFINNERVILPIVEKTTTNMLQKNHISNGVICLFTFPEFRLLDKKAFNHIHFDLGTNNENRFYITAHDKTGGYIYIGEVIEDKIENIKKSEVEDFPHGIHYYENKLGYTSYGTSSVYIVNENDLLARAK